MNQILVATAGLALTILMLGLAKKPKIFFSKITQLNGVPNAKGEEISLVMQPKLVLKEKKIISAEEKMSWKQPRTVSEKIALQKHLLRSISAGPKERLEAINLADRWGNPWVLPILKRGLKDSDSRVMCAAAIAMEKFKGKQVIKKKNQLTSNPPRNVALMR